MDQTMETMLRKLRLHALRERWDEYVKLAAKPRFSAVRLLTRIIEDAVMKLSEDRRMALLLSHYEGLDYKTISKIMKCSEGTVKSRVFRARAELSKLLAPYLAAEPERVM